MAIEYQKFFDEAMLDVVRKVLLHIQKEGMSDDCSLYISFNTTDPLVQLSAKVRQRYPQEITIVLQHQFNNLSVESHNFSVGLSFDGIYEYIKVPFRAMIGFVDPVAKFSLQFTHCENVKSLEKQSVITQDARKVQKNTATVTQNADTVPTTTGNVIMLDKFRNK